MLLSILSLSAVAQTGSMNTSAGKSAESGYEIEVNTGYGSYLMPSLKDLQNYFVSYNNQLGAVKTVSFPDYYNYTVRVGRRNAQNNTYSGFVVGLMSTGARNSLADYSGIYNLDINCMGINFGLYEKRELKYYYLLNRPVRLGYILNGSIIYSFVNLKENISIAGYGTAINDNNQLNSVGIYAEPVFYLNYMFVKNIGLELTAGVGGSISSPLYYQDIRNTVEINNKKLYANWSGYRLGAGIVVNL
jgi:hypothetical protein